MAARYAASQHVSVANAVVAHGRRSAAPPAGVRPKESPDLRAEVALSPLPTHPPIEAGLGSSWGPLQRLMLSVIPESAFPFLPGTSLLRNDSLPFPRIGKGRA